MVLWERKCRVDYAELLRHSDNGTMRLHWKSGCTDGLECEFVCLRRVLRVMARGAGSFAEEKVNYVDFAFATLFGKKLLGSTVLAIPGCLEEMF